MFKNSSNSFAKDILQVVGIFAGMALVYFGFTFLYALFPTLTVVAFTVILVVLALWFTGVIGSVWAAIRGKK